MTAARRLAARLPTRLRLTLAFAAASAVVLVGLAFFLHARLGAQLDAAIDQGLRQRAADLAGLATSGAPLASRGAVDPDEGATQVLDAAGRVVDAPASQSRAPLLTPAQAAQAVRAPLQVDRVLGDDDDAVRVLAVPAGGRAVVVSASLEDRGDALTELDALLALGIPAAVALAGLAGFLVAGRALRPIERMRRHAEAIRAERLAERLPVPAAQDELRRLAETLNAMLDRLEQAFARERRFVADAGHELRTPLARLRTELELAVQPGRSADELRAAVVSAEEEARRLTRLSEDLLVVARADEGRLPVRREPVDVATLLQTVAARFARDAELAGREVVVRQPDAVAAQVAADPLRLEQAVGNLVDNALRHGAGSVQLSAAREGQEVALHVVDEGPGLPEDFAPLAFERFTRADEAREHGGAGLGLAIVRVIAEAHGGSAGVDRARGGGADAWLRVPATWARAGEQPPGTRVGVA